jgi:hypothetical protein
VSALFRVVKITRSAKGSIQSIQVVQDLGDSFGPRLELDRRQIVLSITNGHIFYVLDPASLSLGRVVAYLSRKGKDRVKLDCEVEAPNAHSETSLQRPLCVAEGSASPMSSRGSSRS